MRTRNFRISMVICLVFFTILTGIAESGTKKNVDFITGKTMGTWYHITVVGAKSKILTHLKGDIEKKLAEINKSMSAYDKKSELSTFNRIQETNQPFHVSDGFYHVLEIGKRLYLLTDGYWDGTVNPLVDLWGFGRISRKPEIPDGEKIRNALKHVGFNLLQISENKSIRKKDPLVTLDLSSIAKGFGADATGSVIEDAGIHDYLVEIGGEIKASGSRPDGKAWKVGISLPKPDARPDQLFRVVNLKNKGFATSGNYRQFFIIGNRRYSHIIDPKTGTPVSGNVVSASVVAADCAFADGLATALLCLKPEKSIALVNKLPGVECLIVTQEKNGKLNDYNSSGFSNFLSEDFSNSSGK